MALKIQPIKNTVIIRQQVARKGFKEIAKGKKSIQIHNNLMKTIIKVKTVILKIKI